MQSHFVMVTHKQAKKTFIGEAPRFTAQTNENVWENEMNDK